MKFTHVVYLLILLMFSSCVLLLKIHIGSYTPFHLFFFCFILLVCCFPKATIFNQIFRVDAITLNLLLFIGVILLSYVFNVGEADLVSKNYGSNTGEYPSSLYIKIAANGLIYASVAFFAYRLGKSYCYEDGHFKKICKTIFILCAINAFVNVVAWLFVTKGVIGRYNFEPPLTFSPGVSIQYSMMGFLLGLPTIYGERNKLKLKLLYAIQGILLLSILIILTRQAQLSFLIMYALYVMMTIKLTMKKVLFVIPFAIIAIGVGMVVLFAAGAFDSYTAINSTESTDVVIRVLMINSAYDLFLSHPFLGIGYGMFVGHNNVPIVITGVPTYLASPHNGLAAIVCELGALGVITYLILIIIVLKRMSAARKFVENPIIKRYVTAISVYQVVMVFLFIISNSHLFGPPSEASYLCMSFISWFLIGAVIAVGRKSSLIKEIA